MTTVLAYANLSMLKLHFCGRLPFTKDQPKTTGTDDEHQSANAPQASHPFVLSFSSSLNHLNSYVRTFALRTIHESRLFPFHFALQARVIFYHKSLVLSSIHYPL